MPKTHVTISLDIELHQLLKQNVENVSEWVAGQIRSEFADKYPPEKTSPTEPTIEPSDDYKPSEEFDE